MTKLGEGSCLGYEQLAYDEVANEIFDEIYMNVIHVKDGQLYE